MMDIKCWGSRGSICVSGKPYVKYGGDTTCIEITAKTGETIIIDAGTGIRRLGNSLLKRGVNTYYHLFTHAHWDHILGFAFFRPLQFSKVTIHIQDRLFEDIPTKAVLDEMLKRPFFPISISDLNATLNFDASLNDTFQIGTINVDTIPTNHPGGGIGYKFTEDDKSFVFLTDNELGYQHAGGKSVAEYGDFCKDADLLFHDAEYTPDEYKKNISWGHSTYVDVLDLAIKANIKQLGLFHLNQERTDAQVDDMVADCRADLKKQKCAMDCFAIGCDTSITL